MADPSDTRAPAPSSPIPGAAPLAAAPAARRRRALTLIGAVVLLVGLAYGSWYWLTGRHSETTDNAYVQGNLVQITPQVAGTVVAILADEADSVPAGAALVRLDAADAQVALARAEAQLAQTVRALRGTYAGSATLAAQVVQREAELGRTQSELTRAQADVARRAPLVASGAVGQEEFAHVQAQLAAARSGQAAAQASLSAAREALVAQQTQTDGVSLPQQPAVAEAAVRVREAYLALRRSSLPAPMAGVVARRNVQIGQRVAAGTPLMTLVALDQLWVDANFKEPQLARLRIGQPVTLVADVYGKQVQYSGRIAGLGAGTGAAFALLPAQNATGNWIKVVQRVPVRITLDAAQLARHPLRLGLSMHVTVDVSDTSGATLATASRSAPVAQTTVFDVLTAGCRCRGGAHHRHPRRRGRARCTRRRRRTCTSTRTPLMATAAPPQDHPPLEGSARVLGTVALSLATFMNVLDSSIANVSIPAIAGDLGASPSQATWVITSFGVANAIAVPLTGWLTQRFGAVRLWTTSVLLFVLASMLCGLATSLEMLVAARVLQGLVAGPLMPLSQTLLMASYPRVQAGRALAFWGMTTLVAPVVGPLLGGWLTDNFSWPWIFFINLPVGLFAAAVGWGLYRDARDAHPPPADRHRRPVAAGAGRGRHAAGAGPGPRGRLVRKQRGGGAGGGGGGRPGGVCRLGADRRRIRWSTCACSASATLPSVCWSPASAMACSWAMWCCCRCGCSNGWATPPPRPAWRWHRWGCWPSCCRRWSGARSRSGTRAGWPAGPSWSLPWCCGCARASRRRPTCTPS